MSLKSDDGADVPLPSIENDTVDDDQPMSDGQEYEADADSEQDEIGPMDKDGWYPIERSGRMDTRFRAVDFDSGWLIQIPGSVDGIEGSLNFDIDRKFDECEEEAWMNEADDRVMKGEDSEEYYDNIKEAVQDTYWEVNRESQRPTENEIEESLRSFHRLVLAPPEWAGDMGY
ncbi:hypothetical protein L202_00008 [Cryptococcus amylolentus CBS 6039]|uniref:Uncharacterized protein n=1 Tax=Cryptococcus amylolentus CBS 6039 TaxID=1295533 RepID=A0A1E3I5T6_9TREE|nr:hypothetical protein L202_00008 [Cryptococcus amylolentus CBS 6039]ODN83969.1 hypothetical protein L202_00008 [Cryptococcus amylolentus CBS 6039]